LATERMRDIGCLTYYWPCSTWNAGRIISSGGFLEQRQGALRCRDQGVRGEPGQGGGKRGQRDGVIRSKERCLSSPIKKGLNRFEERRVYTHGPDRDQAEASSETRLVRKILIPSRFYGSRQPQFTQDFLEERSLPPAGLHHHEAPHTQRERQRNGGRPAAGSQVDQVAAGREIRGSRHPLEGPAIHPLRRVPGEPGGAPPRPSGGAPG